MNPMKPLLAIAVSLSLLTGSAFAQQAAGPAGAQAQAPASKAHLLSRTELEALLAKPKKLLLIDVRRPDEITSIGGFPVYLSIQAKDLENSLDYIPKDRQIVTVSNHAGRAAKAADLLASKGFKVVGAAGAETFEKDGGTIVHIAKPEPRPTAANAAPQS
jgi:rhodanese-related sulfurtransferase